MVNSIKPVSQGILNTLNKTTKKKNEELQNLATGKQSQAQDPRVSLVQSEALASSLKGLERADQNITNASALIGTAEEGLQTAMSLLGDLSALSVQAADDLIAPAEREALQARASQLLSALNDSTSSTTFSGQELLTGSFGTKQVQVGANAGDTVSVTLPNATSAALGTDTIDISNADAAGQAITTVDAAILTVASELANAGATQQRLDSAASTNQAVQEKSAEAHSQSTDSNVAAVVMKLKSLQLQQAAGVVLLENAAKSKQN